MKFPILIVAMFVLNSCNTTIGVWRDTKAACSWTQQKIQGSGGGGGESDYDAPVY